MPCRLRLSRLSHPSQDLKPMELCCLQWAGSSSINHQSRKRPTDMPTGNLMETVSPLRFSPQRTLVCVTLTERTNQHKWDEDKTSVRKANSNPVSISSLWGGCCQPQPRWLIRRLALLPACGFYRFSLPRRNLKLKYWLGLSLWWASCLKLSNAGITGVRQSKWLQFSLRDS